MKTPRPDKPSESLSPQRLLEAADAILAAESSEGKGTVTLWTDESRPAHEGFSFHELVEGMMFLRRIGMVRFQAAWPGPERPHSWA